MNFLQHWTKKKKKGLIFWKPKKNISIFNMIHDKNLNPSYTNIQILTYVLLFFFSFGNEFSKLKNSITFWKPQLYKKCNQLWHDEYFNGIILVGISVVFIQIYSYTENWLSLKQTCRASSNFINVAEQFKRIK